VLWLRDLVPGAGWGLLDHEGRPKPVYHFLRRALAPIAVWSIDEGLGGVIAHVANDLPAPLECELRLALYSGGELLVGEAKVPIGIAAHGSADWDVEALLGRFVDLSWAYRFGPPAQDAIVLSLEAPGAHAAPISQSVRFPAGRPLRREAPAAIGLHARVTGASAGANEHGESKAGARGEGTMQLRLQTTRLAYGVSVDVPGYAPEDNWFTLEPEAERIVTLHPLPRYGDSDDHGAAGAASTGTLEALNMLGRVSFALGVER
jgi:beta-mannosidase